MSFTTAATEIGKVSIQYLLMLFIIYSLFYMIRDVYNKYRMSQIEKSKFKPRILIIGAGFSGICIAVDLKKKLNYSNFVIYEKENEVGGMLATSI